jgi:hypothetical protein
MVLNLLVGYSIKRVQVPDQELGNQPNERNADRSRVEPMPIVRPTRACSGSRAKRILIVLKTDSIEIVVEQAVDKPIRSWRTSASSPA